MEKKCLDSAKKFRKIVWGQKIKISLRFPVFKLHSCEVKAACRDAIAVLLDVYWNIYIYIYNKIR